MNKKMNIYSDIFVKKIENIIHCRPIFGYSQVNTNSIYTIVITMSRSCKCTECGDACEISLFNRIRLSRGLECCIFCANSIMKTFKRDFDAHYENVKQSDDYRLRKCVVATNDIFFEILSSFEKHPHLENLEYLTIGRADDTCEYNFNDLKLYLFTPSQINAFACWCILPENTFAIDKTNSQIDDCAVNRCIEYFSVCAYDNNACTEQRLAEYYLSRFTYMIYNIEFDAHIHIGDCFACLQKVPITYDSTIQCKHCRTPSHKKCMEKYWSSVTHHDCPVCRHLLTSKPDFITYST